MQVLVLLLVRRLCKIFKVSISYFATLQILFEIKVGYLLIRLLADISQMRLRELH